MTWLTDPDGNRIELVQWPAGHADGITAAQTGRSKRARSWGSQAVTGTPPTVTFLTTRLEMNSAELAGADVVMPSHVSTVQSAKVMPAAGAVAGGDRGGKAAVFLVVPSPAAPKSVTGRPAA